MASATIEEIPEPAAITAPSMILVSQPSCAAPTHASITSFGKQGINYRKQSVATKVAPAPTKPSSVWPSLQEARDICDAVVMLAAEVGI